MCALSWPSHKKRAVLLLCSMSGLVTLMSGTTMAPALDNIGNDLHLDMAVANLAFSIYILAYAFGPLFLAPFTEIYGRRLVQLFGGTLDPTSTRSAALLRTKPLWLPRTS